MSIKRILLLQISKGWLYIPFFYFLIVNEFVPFKSIRSQKVWSKDSLLLFTVHFEIIQIHFLAGKVRKKLKRVFKPFEITETCKRPAIEGAHIGTLPYLMQ